MAKKTLPKIKTTKMGDLEEKVDSAPKKRRGRPKKLQTAAEVEAAINLKEFQKSQVKLKKEKEKTISARINIFSSLTRNGRYLIFLLFDGKVNSYVGVLIFGNGIII